MKIVCIQLGFNFIKRRWVGGSADWGWVETPVNVVNVALWGCKTSNESTFPTSQDTLILSFQLYVLLWYCISQSLSTVFLVTGAHEVVYMWLDFEMETNLRNHSCRRRAPCHFNKFSLRYIFAFMQLDDWWGALFDVMFCSVAGIFFFTWYIGDWRNNSTGEAINQRICLPNSSKVLI